MSTDLQHLSKYELRQRLAHHRMAEVWKAYDSQLKYPVAIKFLRANVQTDPGFARRFLHEAEVIASLRHPSIVQIRDFGLLSPQEPGVALAYLIMDWVEGQTLAGYIHGAPRLGKVPPGADIAHLFTLISLAIDYAHRSGVIHGNITPNNIFLHQRYTSLPNRIGEPLLTDFGLAGLRGPAAGTLAHRSLETALYMSPEQAQGHAGTERSDIYSLGVILYEMCTGVLPFQGNRPIALMMQHVSAAPTPPSYINPSISPALGSVILRCLAKDPQARFSRASTMAAALAKALDTAVPQQLEALADQANMDNTSSPVDTRQTLSSLPSMSSSSSSPTNRPVLSGTPANGGFDASPSAGAGQDRHSASAFSYPFRRPFRRNAFLPFVLVTLLLATLVGSGLAALLSLVPRSAAPTSALVGHAFFVSSGQLNGSSNQGIIDEL